MCFLVYLTLSGVKENGAGHIAKMRGPVFQFVFVFIFRETVFGNGVILYVFSYILLLSERERKKRRWVGRKREMLGPFFPLIVIRIGLNLYGNAYLNLADKSASLW